MTAIGAPRSLILGATRPRLEDVEAPPILSIGFRPFFFLATLMAVVWVPLWLMLLSAKETSPALARSGLSPTALHAHEMIFGFTVAVIAGFLLTAGANWTGVATTNRRSLFGLTILWLSGRASMVIPEVPSFLRAAIDVAFLPALALTLGVALIRTESRRNFQFLFMLGLLTIANILAHAESAADFSQLTHLPRGTGSTLALRVVTFMILVMGGRVIPMFTRNATRNDAIRSVPWIERAGLVLFALAAAVDLALGGTIPSAALLVLAGIFQLFRMSTWGTRHARAPLLWILHAGFFCVALSLVVEGLADFGILSKDAARHLLTVGGIGGLCLGMMTRVSLGHSGRMLTAPRAMHFSFAFLLLGTAIRAFGPFVEGVSRLFVYQSSGILWTASFLLLLLFGIPIWFRPRVDQP